VNLQSIAVNGQILPIDPSVFTIATGDGTIIDTGTTLAYLPDEAYSPFIQAVSVFFFLSSPSAFSVTKPCIPYSVVFAIVESICPQMLHFWNEITIRCRRYMLLDLTKKKIYKTFNLQVANAVSQYGRPITYESYQCFEITAGDVDVFPQVSLSFAGGASMVLGPRAYLQIFSSSGSSIWCIGFQRMSHRRITILGDLVLKDKVVVYDLVRQRIGWAEYDCSLEVNVSASRGGRSKDVINTGQWRESGSESFNRSYYLLQLVVFLVHLFARFL
jgi:hypothetical protein